MKHLSAVLLTALLTSAFPAAARIYPSGSAALTPKVTKQATEFTPRPLQQNPAEASSTRANLLLEEDFAKVPDGDRDEIGRCVTYIASNTNLPGPFVPAEYVNGEGTWWGDNCFAGENGTVILQTPTMNGISYIAVPLSDWSGNLTVTVRARFAPGYIQNGTDIIETEGSTVAITPYIGGYYSPKVSTNDIGAEGTTTIYPDDGWVEFSLTFTNEDADNDGTIIVATTDAVEIDYIRIVDNCTYLAAPKVTGISDITPDGFTINLEPVRRAYSYYIDLWKKTWLAPSGIDTVLDFEGESLPEGSESDKAELAAGVGDSETNAVSIAADGYYSTPNYKATLDEATLYIKVDLPNLMQSFMAQIVAEGLTADGWEAIASYPAYASANSFLRYNVVTEKNAGKYYSVRIKGDGFNEGDKILVDNIALKAQRPYSLARDENSQLIHDPENDDNPYNVYKWTESKYDTAITISGLDPEAEYIYRVRSHNMYQFSGGEKHFALGVATPEVAPAKEISRAGAYSVEWKDVPHADEYIVGNYFASVVEETEEDYPLISEAFSPTAGKETTALGNKEEIALDEYTDYRGWKGYNCAYGDGWIGFEPYSDGSITTPPLVIEPDRDASLYIFGEGTPGDALVATYVKGGNYIVINVGADGYFRGTLPLVAGSIPAGERVRFESAMALNLKLYNVELNQDVYAGEVIRSLESEQTVLPGVEKCTFSDLDSENLYAYTVTGVWHHETATAYSLPSRPFTVDLATGKSEETASIASPGSDAEVYEVARYSMQGLPVADSCRGMVIVKMSDGSVRKVFNNR